MTKQPMIGAALVGLLMMPMAAVAAPVVFFGEDLGAGEFVRLDATPNADAARGSFQGKIVQGAMESFESFQPGTFAWTHDPIANSWTPGLALPFTASIGGAGPIGGTISAATGTVIEVPHGTNNFGRYPTDGDKLFHSKADPITFEFDRPVYAFGLDIIDAGDFGGEVSISTYAGETLLHTFAIAHVLNGDGGNVFFWGLVDAANPFNKIAISMSTIGGDTIGLDRLLVGTVVTPIPAALPLMAAGIVALGWMRRRQAVRASA